MVPSPKRSWSKRPNCSPHHRSSNGLKFSVQSFRSSLGACRAILFAAFGFTTSAAALSAPTIDGVIGSKEWAGARRERLIGGGEVLLLRAGADLYIAVSGAGRGYPSLCVGDFER